MTTVNIYLYFDGKCEQAFEFYKSIFKTEYSYFSRFKDYQRGEATSGILKGNDREVLHVALPISKETILMGSDIGNSNTAFLKGNNFAVNVTVDSVKEADRLFKHLSSGGHVVMPMNTMIWGDYLGKFIDQFGVQWIIIYEPK